MRQLFCCPPANGGLAGGENSIHMVSSDEQKLSGEETDHYRSAPANKDSPEEWGTQLAILRGKSVRRSWDTQFRHILQKLNKPVINFLLK